MPAIDYTSWNFSNITSLRKNSAKSLIRASASNILPRLTDACIKKYLDILFALMHKSMGSCPVSSGSPSYNPYLCPWWTETLVLWVFPHDRSFDSPHGSPYTYTLFSHWYLFPSQVLSLSLVYVKCHVLCSLSNPLLSLVSGSDHQSSSCPLPLSWGLTSLLFFHTVLSSDPIALSHLLIS